MTSNEIYETIKAMGYDYISEVCGVTHNDNYCGYPDRCINRRDEFVELTKKIYCLPYDYLEESGGWNGFYKRFTIRLLDKYLELLEDNGLEFDSIDFINDGTLFVYVKER